MMAYNRTQPVISMFAMSIREHPILESHQAAVDITFTAVEMMDQL